MLAHKIALDPTTGRSVIGGVGLCTQGTGLRAVAKDGGRKASLTCGRRAGKSFVLALIAAYLAISKDWGPLSRPRCPYGLHKSFYGTIVI